MTEIYSISHQNLNQQNSNHSPYNYTYDADANSTSKFSALKKNNPYYNTKQIESRNEKEGNIEKTITDIVNKTLDEKLGKSRNDESENEENSCPNMKQVKRRVINDMLERKDKHKNHTNAFNFEMEHIKQENITLKNDNIILREDINRLNEIGVSLENELEFTRKKK